MIIEDGDLWIVQEDPGGGAEGPLVGLPNDYGAAVEQAYLSYCQSIWSQQCFCRCDPDDVLIEDKSIGKLPALPGRNSYGRTIRASTHYKRLISQEQHLATRQFRTAVQTFRNDLQKLVRGYREGRIQLAIFREEASKRFQEIYTKAWENGRRASGILRIQDRPNPPTRREEQWFRNAVREELMHWNAFVDELQKNKEWTGRKFKIPERVEMYVQTVWFMFNTARISGLPDTVLLHWFPTVKKTRMCPGCQFMVDNAPYPRDVMPTTPRAGDTPCLMRCVHKVIVRHVTPGDVERRRKALPSKESLLRSLRRIMGGKIRKRRKKSKDYNPWLGQTTWGELR